MTSLQGVWRQRPLVLIYIMLKPLSSYNTLQRLDSRTHDLSNVFIPLFHFIARIRPSLQCLPANLINRVWPLQTLLSFHHAGPFKTTPSDRPTIIVSNSLHISLIYQIYLEFVCLDDLPFKGTLQTPSRDINRQAGNSQHPQNGKAVGFESHPSKMPR